MPAKHAKSYAPIVQTLSMPVDTLSNGLRFSGKGKTKNARRSVKQWLKDFWQKTWHILKAPFRWMGCLLEKLGLKKKATKKPEPSKGPSTEISPPEQKSASETSAALSSTDLEQLPNGPLTTQQLFGVDPTRITFQQKAGNTCYLLSALDNIFHHPKAARILDLIKVNRIDHGFSVKFPGQKDPVEVLDREMQGDKYSGVISDCVGVRLMERAYSQVPGTKYPAFDTGAYALKRIFGNEVIDYEREHDKISKPPYIATEAQNPARTAKETDYADIWTGVTASLVDKRDESGQPVLKEDGKVDKKLELGQHYYSFRINPGEPSTINLVNPYDTAHFRAISPEEVLADWQAELVRIPLPKPS